MAMLITKFHRLIQSRLLWLGFLIVIVFSFVIWGMQMPDSSAQGPNAAGRLEGEDITFEQYQQSRFNTYLSIVLMTGRAINITPEIEEQLHEMAWQRIVTLREASRLGIAAGNDEVVNAIRGLEFLQAEGRFNQQAYDQFAQQFLAQYRASKRDFEEHVRQEIILQKFRAILSRTQLVTPLEINRTFTTLTDTFTIEYVLVPATMVDGKINVSEEEVTEFFDKDPEQFTQPERMKVKAAVFPVADFADQVEISDEEVMEYYDLNLDDYALPAPESATETNEFSLATTEYKPVEDVREDIIKMLKIRQAALLATAKADEFVQELSYQRSLGRAAFDQVAATQGVQLVVTTPFAIMETPSELEEATPALSRAAFNLSDDEDYYYSDPIAGSNFVYVLALVERQPSRVPELDEVRDEVRVAARQVATYKAIEDKAREIQGSLVAGLSAGLAFDDVVGEYKLKPVKPAPFSVNSQDIDPVITESLIRPLLVLNPGEVTDIIEADEGFLIAYVKERSPVTDTTVDSMRTQIVNSLRQQGANAAFSDYQNYLLKQYGFEDLTRRQRNADDEEAATEEEI